MKVTVWTSQTTMKDAIDTVESGYLAVTEWKGWAEYKVKVTNNHASATIYIGFYRDVTTTDWGLRVQPWDDEVFDIANEAGADGAELDNVKMICDVENTDIHIAITA